LNLPVVLSLLRKFLLVSLLPAALTLTACKVPDAKPVPPPSEAEGTTWLNSDVVLYMPDRIMKARIRVEDLSPYMKAVDKAAEQVVLAAPKEAGSSGMLLIAMRPNGQSRAWVVTGKPEMSQALADQMIAAAEAVPVPAIKEETVLMGINFHAFGGGVAPVSAGPPIPRDWYSHFSKDGGVLDDALLAKVWPQSQEAPVGNR
jgi:hypothetical protein